MIHRDGESENLPMKISGWVRGLISSGSGPATVSLCMTIIYLFSLHFSFVIRSFIFVYRF